MISQINIKVNEHRTRPAPWDEKTMLHSVVGMVWENSKEIEFECPPELRDKHFPQGELVKVQCNFDVEPAKYRNQLRLTVQSVAKSEVVELPKI